MPESASGWYALIAMEHDENWKLKRLERLLPASLVELVHQVAAKEGGDPLMLLADLIRSAATARLTGSQVPLHREDATAGGHGPSTDVGVHALAPLQEGQIVLFMASEMTPEQARALDGALAGPDDVLDIEELALLPE